MMRRLATLVGSGSSVAAAGRKLEIDPSTASAWGRSPQFKAMVERVRNKIDDRVIGTLVRASIKAAKRLDKLVDSPNENVALSACKTLMEKRHEVESNVAHAKRMTAIEQGLAAFASANQINSVIDVKVRPAALEGPALPEATDDGQTPRDATPGV